VLSLLKSVVNFSVGLLTAVLISSSSLPNSALAQGLISKEVTDPQAHMAAIAQPCFRGVGTCIREGFVLSFGEGARGLESLDPVINAYGKMTARNWIILSDTSYSDTARWIYGLVICENGVSLFLRAQFSKLDGNWRINMLDVNSLAKDIFIPLPPGGVQVPITQIASPPR
jgi:hypothetical protein